MKKFIGFGVLLALIIVPMGTASAQIALDDCNLYPLVPSGVGTYSSLLAVTNNGAIDWVEDDPGNPAVITRFAPGLAPRITNFDVEAGDTIFVAPSDFFCPSGGVCRVTITNTEATLTSTLFLTNGGEVFAVMSPIPCVLP
jgi:hypothetical protein